MMWIQSTLCLLCLGALGLVTSQESLPRYVEQPEFCKKLTCPGYIVLDKLEDEDHEERNVESRMFNQSMMWVSTSVVMDDVSDRSWLARMWARLWNRDNQESEMFNKLFNYIRGNNDGNMEIDMTAPVLTRYQQLYNLQNEPLGKVNVSMYFYLAIPEAPFPLDQDVHVFVSPPGQSYDYIGFSLGGPFLVRSFETRFWTSRRTWDENVAMLKEGADYIWNELDRDFNMEEIDPSVYYRVSYDGPWTWTRHEEVWMEPFQVSKK